MKFYNFYGVPGQNSIPIDAGLVALANEKLQNVETYYPTEQSGKVDYAGQANEANWVYDYNLYGIPGIWDIQFNASLGQAVINADDFWYKGQVKSANVGEGFGFLKMKNGGVWRGFQNETMQAGKLWF